MTVDIGLTIAGAAIVVALLSLAWSERQPRQHGRARRRARERRHRRR